MPTVTNGATRKFESDLIKGYNKFEDENGVNYCFATVSVKGSGAVDNIGTILKWNAAGSVFYPFTINADWAADTEYALGAVVKPATQNGYEYVCIKAGTSNDTEGEPTFPTTPGATVTETDGVIWLCRRAYTGDASTLPDGSEICVTVGAAEGKGVNQTDTTLSSTASKMTVIYRGPATLVEEGFEWGEIAAVDQDEVYAALERKGISVADAATVVVPTFV